MLDKSNCGQSIEKLHNRVIQPILDVCGLLLKTVHYFDPTGPEFFCDNAEGIHILGGQIALQFEAEKFLFLSWDQVGGWEQYTLGCSNASFFNTDIACWEMGADAYWGKFVNARINACAVFGYPEWELDSSTELAYKQPHAVELVWDNGLSVVVANFYYSEDFCPRLAIGDDLWIIFDKSVAEGFYKILNLKCIAQTAINPAAVI